MILIWQFGDRIKIAKLTYAIIDSSILQAWVFLYTSLYDSEIHQFKIPPTAFSEQTTIAYISAYVVHYTFTNQTPQCILYSYSACINNKH